MSKYPPRSTAKQQLLNNEDFLTSLTELLSQSNGSIYLTQKRLEPQYLTSNLETFVGVDQESQLLLRATNGKDKKISTRVAFDNLSAFMEKYGEVCRAGMGAGLKKRDRKKVKKVK